MSQDISLSVDVKKPSPKLWSVFKEWGNQIAEVAADSHSRPLEFETGYWKEDELCCRLQPNAIRNYT
jgi:hypothetical protein